MPPTMPPQNTQPTMPPMNQPGSMGSAMPPTPPKAKPVGPFVGIIIIILLMVLGGIYFWGSKIETLRTGSPSADEVRGTPDASTESLGQQADSDDVNSIQADMNATDVSNLNQESAVIESLR